MTFHENHLLAEQILKKYHNLIFSKIKKDVVNLSSAADMIGALRVNFHKHLFMY